MLLVSGLLAWLTTRYVEDPLRAGRRPATRQTPKAPSVPLRTRLRRPTIVLGSMVALLGVALTATSFTWREHVTVLARQRQGTGRASRRATIPARARC